MIEYQRKTQNISVKLRNNKFWKAKQILVNINKPKHFIWLYHVHNAICYDLTIGMDSKRIIKLLKKSNDHFSHKTGP